MFRFLSGVVLVLLALLPAMAQETSILRRSTGGTSTVNPVQQLRERLGQVRGTESLLAQEGAVDPDAYTVGPGDMFILSIGGGTPLQVPATVLADGHLLLPDGTSVKVDGRSLTEAQAAIVARLRERYAHVPVHAALAQPRQFYVHLTGLIPRPGRYLSGPTTRLESLLNEAFMLTTEAQQARDTEPEVSSTTLPFEPSLRTIRIEHRDGSVTSVDLVRYYTTGDTDHNPYLRDGDRVYVPGYLPGRDGVFVDGRIPFPGTYPYREGDRIRDLVLIGTGGIPPNPHIRLLRPATALDTLLHGPDALDVPVKPGDHVFILSPEPRGTITLEGRVRYPGTYPITPGRTTLGEVLTHAGGLLPDALVRGVYIERGPEPSLPVRAVNLTSLPAPPPPLPDTSTMTYMQGLKGDFFSRMYLNEQLRTAARRVAVNLEDASSGALDFPLQDGDRIVVPRDEHTVLVIGRVVRPGFVAYEPGKRVADYLEQAGGLAPGARTIYVRDAGSGQWKTGKKHPVYSGDIIYVDWKDTANDRFVQQLAIQRRDIYFRGIQTALAAVGTVTTVITTYLLVRDRLK